MSISFLRDLSAEEKKQALLRISQFVLRTPSGEVREGIYKRLLEIGIFLLQKEKKCDLDKVLNSITENFFGIYLNKEAANKYLLNLQEERTIRIENGRYILDEKRISQIEDYSKKSLSLVTSMEKKLIEQVSRGYEEKISSEDMQVVKDSFYQFILLLVSKYIINVAKLLVKGKLARISVSTGKTIVESSTISISNERLREVVTNLLMEWMQSPDDDFIEYLFNMRQNFLCIEVLNLDPNCRMLQREAFSKKRLFLDTNVLMNLSLRTRTLHEQIKKLISNTVKLGCALYVTERTIEEFNNVLNNAKDLFKGISATPKQISRINDPFIRSYGLIRQSGSSLLWKDYVNQFSDMRSLLRETGIQVYDEKHEEIGELENYPETIKAIQRCFKIHRNREKKSDVAEHDAFHLLLVKTLRESETPLFFGPDTWFLTLDLTLPCVDRFINRTYRFSDTITPTMSGYFWDEMISPFLVGIVEERDLLDIFKTFVISDFTPISEDINAKVLAKLDIDWTEFDWLEIEEIQSILQQQFVLDFVQRQEEYSHTGDHEAIEKIRTEFNIAFNSFVGRISNRKIEDIRKQLAEKETQTKKLKRTVDGLEKSKDELRDSLTTEETLTIRMRYGAGIAGFILLSIGIIEIIRARVETSVWHITGSYIACLLIGAILLLMAIRPEQVSGILNVGKKG